MSQGQWLALFRGINVGGRHIIPMKTLSQIMQQAGCENVRTYIQSGNVIFSCNELNKAELASKVGNLVEQRCHFLPKVLVLSTDDFRHIVCNNPYPEAISRPKSLQVFFLESPAQSADIVRLTALKSPTEQFHLSEQAFYLLAPDGIGRSKLAEKVEKYLGVTTTARNLSTLLKLDELLSI